MQTNQIPVRCVVMRGGTSESVFFREADLPRDASERDRTILAVMGSPDPRQINGLGGADHLTSKIAIIGDGRTHDAHVTLVNEVCVDRSDGYIRIGHPTGVFPCFP